MKVFALVCTSLPNGSTIANRIAKAAMEESMADGDQAPSEALMALYQAWGPWRRWLADFRQRDGRWPRQGLGRGRVLEDASQLDKFKRWAQAGRAHGAQFWDADQPPRPPDAGQPGQPTRAPSAVELNPQADQALQPTAGHDPRGH